MRIRDVIAMVDGLKPNQYTGAQKVRWLSDCDSAIWHSIIEIHEKDAGMPDRFDGYDPDEDMETALLAPPPYDVLYRHYLEMQIDLYNKELNAYNNSARLYNTAYLAFESYYNKRHMPAGRATHFIL